MVATFSETSAVTSEKYVVKQGMNKSKSFKNFELIWMALLGFCFTLIA